MSSKLSPCVAMILCVAGCNSTETLEMPQSRSIGPPNFNKSKLAEGRKAPAQPIPQTAKLSLPSPQAVRVTGTAFESVPNTYISGAGQSYAAAPFSPIRQAETAVAMSSPMPDALAPAMPEIVEGASSEPQYIHIGQLWPEERHQLAAAPVQSAEIVSSDGRYVVAAAPLAPLRAALPVAKPVDTVVLSMDAPAVTPLPRAAQSPGLPAVVEVVAQPAPAIEIIEPVSKPILMPGPVAQTSPAPVQVTMAMPSPIAQPVLTDELLTDANASAFAGEGPLVSRTPMKPPRTSSYQVPPPEMAGAGPDEITAPADCFVSRGSNERMILVCQGKDVSPSQVFRAVTEGESAFRGLRDFDSTDRVIGTYGFNSTRFNAMSRGPRSEEDITFLRALRRSRRSVQVKGRPFDMYLMKGDNSLATVLVEQAMAPERRAVGARN